MSLDPAQIPNGYWFTAADLPTLQVASYYPERTTRESGVIRDYLLAHGGEFDRFGFSVRVGQALQPDPTHLIGVQKSTIYSSRKRIDLVGIRLPLHTLVEAKARIEPSALGQILTYDRLYRQDNPSVTATHLVVIGRYTDTDTQRALNAHGVDVFIYTEGSPSR
jgi:hypothetical protein